jgi:hypothetical protein
MAEIGQFDKISTLWPTLPGRSVEKSGQRQQSSKKDQHEKPQQDNKQVNEDGPGKNIDEYA